MYFDKTFIDSNSALQHPSYIPRRIYHPIKGSYWSSNHRDVELIAAGIFFPLWFHKGPFLRMYVDTPALLHCWAMQVTCQ